MKKSKDLMCNVKTVVDKIVVYLGFMLNDKILVALATLIKKKEKFELIHLFASL